MRFLIVILLFVLPFMCFAEGATRVQTPYAEQKVVYDFYFDEPLKINSALYWIRSLMNPLGDDPYNYAPELMDIVVVIHGTEIVTDQPISGQSSVRLYQQGTIRTDPDIVKMLPNTKYILAGHCSSLMAMMYIMPFC